VDARALAALATPERAAPAAALTPDEVRLRRIWSDVLRTDAIGPDDTFAGLGGSSLLAIRMVARVEEEFGGRLPVRAVFTSPTLRELALEIRRRSPSPPSPAVVRLREHPTRPPLFCLPGAGGHVFSYRALVEHLPPDVPVYGLQIQELGTASDALESVEGLAAEMLRQVRAVRPKGPYALLGYSFGGTVAYEMARQLEAAGEGGGLLVLIDAYPTGSLREKRGLAKWGVHWRNLSGRSLRGKWRYLADVLAARRERRAPSEEAGDPDSLEARVAIVESRCRVAYLAHRPGPYAGPVTVLRARLSDWLAVDAADETGGWRRLVAGRIDTRLVSCEHREVFDEPNLRELARLVHGAYAAYVAPLGGA
jgi:thioesterase domain-containing protein